MEASAQDLVERYSQMSDEELIELAKVGSLTEIAHKIINKELENRNLDVNAEVSEPSPPVPEKRKFKSRLVSGAYGFVTGFFVGASLLSSAITNHNPTFQAEVVVRSAIGIFIGLLFLLVFLFISEKKAKRSIVYGLAIFFGYYVIKLI